MEILVLNSGSSSLKFQLIETSPEQIQADADRIRARGSVEKIGTGEAIISVEAGGAKTKHSREILEHRDAVGIAASCLQDAGDGLRKEQIEGVGHRIVHGGEQFTQSVLIDDEVLRHIQEAIELAPLHNPHNLKGYLAAREMLPQAQHAAVFDTSFHQTLPRHAFMYGLPHVVYDRHRVRRYGFHGTSHRYVSYRYARMLGRTRQDYKLITCHLGNGCSVCAIDHGRSVDTSMGFTPLEGLLMGTRAGDIDPAAVLHVMAKEELSIHEVSSLLNKHSGLYGLSGISNDMRTLIEQSGQGNDRARLAIRVFCYRAKKYIGAYLATLNGADAVLFTGGIGENAPSIRAEICDQLDALGIVLDPASNEAARGQACRISSDDSACQVWVIPTNEELLIARDTLRCILGLPHP
jgi:acetate kinase